MRRAEQPLGVVVVPHAMEIGGSQLNAIELAAAVRDLGHDVVVYSEDGPLVDRVDALGLIHVAQHPAARRPAPARALHLARLARHRRVDVIHGYEWPPILEAWAAAGLVPGTVAVGTVMSMAVAPFLPDRLPLVVGTQRIRASVGARRGGTHVIEPPVDTTLNRPGEGAEGFARRFPVAAGTVRVVVVCRLVRELKLEGLLTAVRAVRRLADQGGDGPRVHLTVVGDGPDRDEVVRAAALANAGIDLPVVTLTGELSDPRGAYAVADVALGMGGSALRSLAFGTPLVVQGEGGFFEVLDAQSLPMFLDQGFYGTDTRDEDQAVDHLVGLLGDLAADPAARAALGTWGRGLVERSFSLASAAATQVDVYRHAVAARPGAGPWLAGGLQAAPGLVSYKVERWRGSRRGVVARDDFNARPV